jgi:Uri superfamily endonuclease
MHVSDPVCLEHPALAGGAKGTYLLIMQLAQESCLTVGSLKTCRFPAGCLIYVGSALGPGGLRARLRHHLRPARRLHWHLDYLRSAAKVTAIVFAADGSRREHGWARVLAGLAQASIPVPGFGASDCACSAHLFHLSALPDVDFLLNQLCLSDGEGFSDLADRASQSEHAAHFIFV